jgi:hypothetical protein
LHPTVAPALINRLFDRLRLIVTIGGGNSTIVFFKTLLEKTEIHVFFVQTISGYAQSTSLDNLNYDCKNLISKTSFCRHRKILHKNEKASLFVQTSRGLSKEVFYQAMLAKTKVLLLIFF